MAITTRDPADLSRGVEREGGSYSTAAASAGGAATAAVAAGGAVAWSHSDG